MENILHHSSLICTQKIAVNIWGATKVNPVLLDIWFNSNCFFLWILKKIIYYHYKTRPIFLILYIMRHFLLFDILFLKNKFSTPAVWYYLTPIKFTVDSLRYLFESMFVHCAYWPIFTISFLNGSVWVITHLGQIISL